MPKVRGGFGSRIIERVFYQTGDIPSPYDRWVEGRNGNYARVAANILGSRFSGKTHSSLVLTEKDLVILSQPVSGKMIEQIGQANILGGIERQVITKASFHPAFSKSDTPSSYQLEFAESIGRVVLPGYTVFSERNLIQAYKVLSNGGQNLIRLKRVNASDISGQCVLKSKQDLDRTVAEGFISQEDLEEEGIVFEVDLVSPKTISIAEINFAGEEYTRIAFQDEIRDGRLKFGGGVVQVVKGGISDLLGVVVQQSMGSGNGSNPVIAVKQSEVFINEYRKINPETTYVAVDVVQGGNAQGQFLSGVTDLTVRAGGFTGAELEIIKRLLVNGSKSGCAVVRLDYSLDTNKNDSGIIYLDDPELKITVEVV